MNDIQQIHSPVFITLTRLLLYGNYPHEVGGDRVINISDFVEAIRNQEDYKNSKRKFIRKVCHEFFKLLTRYSYGTYHGKYDTESVLYHESFNALVKLFEQQPSITSRLWCRLKEFPTFVRAKSDVEDFKTCNAASIERMLNAIIEAKSIFQQELLVQLSVLSNDDKREIAEWYLGISHENQTDEYIAASTVKKIILDQFS